MYQTILNATKDVSFLPPEGKYPGRLVALKDMPLTEAKPHPRIRLLFKLEVPNSGGITFMAGRNIPPNLSIGSDLYWFLKPWIGEKMTMIEEAGNLLGLVNEEGLVTVKHIVTKHYPRPYVNVECVEPLNPVAAKTVTVLVPKFVPVQPEKANTVSTNTSTGAQAFLSASRPEKCVCCGQALPVAKG